MSSSASARCATVPAYRSAGTCSTGLKPENNGAGNKLQFVAVGRKSWLCAGSLEGARRAAALYTLAQGCKLAGLEPFRYFEDVLLRLATHPSSRVDELTPAGWAAAFGNAAS